MTAATVDIRALPTEYGGVTFRSRTEARWALFFDRTICSWEYEPEGFDLGEHGWYLPDFLVTNIQGGEFWVEVKRNAGAVTPEVINTCAALVQQTQIPCWVLAGSPRPNVYRHWGLYPHPQRGIDFVEDPAQFAMCAECGALELVQDGLPENITHYRGGCGVGRHRALDWAYRDCMREKFGVR